MIRCDISFLDSFPVTDQGLQTNEPPCEVATVPDDVIFVFTHIVFVYFRQYFLQYPNFVHIRTRINVIEPTWWVPRGRPNRRHHRWERSCCWICLETPWSGDAWRGARRADENPHHSPSVGWNSKDTFFCTIVRRFLCCLRSSNWTICHLNAKWGESTLDWRLLCYQDGRFKIFYL